MRCRAWIGVAAGVFFFAACASETEDGAWEEGVELPKDRFEAYGAVAHGKLYFLGGITGVFGDISTAEPSRRVDIFDPETARWSSGPDLPADAPKHHLAVAIADDRIFVVGGFDGIIDQHPNEPFLPIGVAYVLEGEGTIAAWRRLAPPPLARGASTAQAIDGKIYVAGGAKNEGVDPESELDIYDIAGDAWTVGARMPTAREHLASCAIDGKMIAIGGWAGFAKTSQGAVESYDPKTNAWTALAPMPTRRGGLAAAARGTECHAVGGEDWALPFPGTFGAHEVFDTRTGVWIARASMPTARHGLGLGWLSDRLWAVGGGPSQGNSYTAIVEIFTP